jgi:hypothetical protein
MVLNRCLIRVVVRRATERTFYLGLKLVEVDTFMIDSVNDKFLYTARQFPFIQQFTAWFVSLCYPHEDCSKCLNGDAGSFGIKLGRTEPL